MRNNICRESNQWTSSGHVWRSVVFLSTQFVWKAYQMRKGMKGKWYKSTYAINATELKKKKWKLVQKVQKGNLKNPKKLLISNEKNITDSYCRENCSCQDTKFR